MLTLQFNICLKSGCCCLLDLLVSLFQHSLYIYTVIKHESLHCISTVRRDVQQDDEEAVRVKEQSILELGTLLAKTGQAAGKIVRSAISTLNALSFVTMSLDISLSVGSVLNIVDALLPLSVQYN